MPIETQILFAERFRMERELGEGLIGRVYLAEDTIRREQVAIKILHPDVTRDAGGLKQMIPVLRAVTQLAHPNIARAYDFNEWNGHVYLSTEFLAGRNLREILNELSERSDHLPATESSRIILEIAQALAYAAPWTAHGGLKPENIWLLNGGQVRLSDFGLNQLLPPEKFRAGVTLFGQGSYIPPEWYEDLLQLTPTGDQYALGLIWLEMVTGQHGQTRTMNLARDESVPLSCRPVLSRLLRRNPEERFPEPDRLSALMAELRSSPQRPRLIETLRRPRVKWWLAWSGAICGLTVTLVWIGSLLSAQRKADQNIATDLAILRSGWQQWDNRRLDLFQTGFADPEWRDALAREFAPGNDWEMLRQLFASDIVGEDASRRQIKLNAARQALQVRGERLKSASIAMREMKVFDSFLDQIERINADPQEESIAVDHDWSQRREEVVQSFQRGAFRDAAKTAAVLRDSARQELESIWNAAHANAVAARDRWATELRRFSLSYIEPAEDLTVRLKAAEQMAREEGWPASASELRALRTVFEAWADELEAVPPLGDSMWQNSLGMRFVDLAEFRVSIWETRVMDFARFGQESGADHRFMWVREAKAGGPTHPVASITFIDAVRFCQWLTEREQNLGLIQKNQAYRLPTDLEWSRIVGLPEEPADSPAKRSLLRWDHFPWGTEPWRTAESGNYDTWPNATKENGFAPAGPDFPMDPFYQTAPVGRFPPNASGIYDLGGNVWEFVVDARLPPHVGNLRIVRGGGWRTIGLDQMRSTYRHGAGPDNPEIGFRCVLASTPETD